MRGNLIRKVYNFSHDLIYRLFLLNKKIKSGHISEEHLQNPELDDKLSEDLKAAGISCSEISIDPDAYSEYLKKTGYPESYYGGGLDAGQNFVEKTLEHFISLEFMDLNPESVFIDIAACTSPFYRIIKKIYQVKNSFQQDLVFPEGIQEDKIGGYASNIPFPDNTVDAVTLHCSLEHFEFDSDTEFFIEMQKVLKPGGKIIVAPFYIARSYTIHVDPAYNLIKFHKPGIDPEAELRYCDWYQYFSRHYNVMAINRRILDKAPGLKLHVYRVMNFKDIHPSTYLRFVAVFTKL